MALADMEQANARILARREASKTLPPYRAALTGEITEILSSYFAKVKPGAAVSGVRRVGGGASKEQFFFTLTDQDGAEPYLLRMDPRKAITETDREREFVLLRAMQGVVPVPEPVWVDNFAEHFPQPAAIMRVVSAFSQCSREKRGASNTSYSARHCQSKLAGSAIGWSGLRLKRWAAIEPRKRRASRIWMLVYQSSRSASRPG